MDTLVVLFINSMFKFENADVNIYALLRRFGTNVYELNRYYANWQSSIDIVCFTSLTVVLWLSMTCNSSFCFFEFEGAA